MSKFDIGRDDDEQCTSTAIPEPEMQLLPTEWESDMERDRR